MYGKHRRNPIRNFLALVVAPLFLSACLSGEDDGDSFAEQEPPSQNSAPVISGSPSTAIVMGNTYSFRPSASDADGDALTFSIENKPVWTDFNTSTGELSGQPTLAHVGVHSNVRISVTDGQASASLPNFSVTVNQAGNLSATLSWVAPTKNEDGSALTDLAGYKIYWGTTSGVYTNSVTIDTIASTTFVVENLSPGTYEFVATAFNTAGVESVYSNPATKVLN